MTIMVVEDNARFRLRIQKWIIQRLSAITTVYECTDGIQAVEMYGAFRPDWVLMDVKLPSMDGLEATRRILRQFSDARIIILTNYNDQAFRDEASRIGARGYVLKENLEDVGRVIGEEVLP